MFLEPSRLTIYPPVTYLGVFSHHSPGCVTAPGNPGSPPFLVLKLLACVMPPQKPIRAQAFDGGDLLVYALQPRLTPPVVTL